MRSITFAVRHRGAVVYMDKVAWEALLAQARANRDLAQALLLAMPLERGCSVPPGSDELQAWFQDADGVAAVGEAMIGLVQEGVPQRALRLSLSVILGSSLEAAAGEASGNVAPSARRQCLSFFVRSRSSPACSLVVFPLMARRALVLVVRAMLLAT